MSRWVCLALLPTIVSFHLPQSRMQNVRHFANLPSRMNEHEPSVLFYTGQFPSEIYGDFLRLLRQRMDVKVAKDVSEFDEYTDCIITHSFAANDVLRFSKTHANTSLVLIDPTVVTFPTLSNFENNVASFIEANKFKMVFNHIWGNKISNNVLVLHSKLSRRWKVIPPIPPLRNYAIDVRGLSNKVVREIDGYGHFDIMDSYWANIGRYVAAGTVEEDVATYHEIVADAVADFVNPKNTTIV